MTDTPDTPRGFTVRRAILAILGFQVGMAVVLAGSDLIGAIPQLLSGPNAPALDAPVAPGDQVRRFRPGDLPGRERLSPDRQTPIPDPGDMPSRLRFSAEGETALVTGDISPGDADRFTEWLTGAENVTTIRLHSPGGSVTDALIIGAALREADLNTVMEDGDICLSACPYILAGGVMRTVPDEAMVGVHQHYFGESTALPAFLAVEDIQRGQADVMAHLDAMGVDVRVMQHALSTPPEAIYVLLPEELVEYRMVYDPSEEDATSE
ncbi:hypothetical protein [Gymnodinialimonas hymeniacidonis]|uniref:hypothetical protein n=1 Tax=Gymnodinialimonas hymeniacidonis TaxID=3126508 RepID=UPI0034C65D3E